MSIISSYSGFQPLEEVLVGDTYPAHFYDHLSPEVRDSFYQITEWTKHDLNLLENKLTELGVTVRRPQFSNNPQDYMDYTNNLVKPPICPRDYVIALGKTLYLIPQGHNVEPWQDSLDYYQSQGGDVQVLNRFSKSPDPLCFMNPPSVTRVGRDLFIEHHSPEIEKVAEKFSQEYRVHLIKTGGHNDAIFCPIKPGYIFSTHYFDSYSDSFPGWEVYYLKDTTVNRAKYNNGFNGKWWLPGVDNAVFNQHILNQAADWIGDFKETVFEVNMLIVDEKNLICINEDETALRKLESLGITPHVIDFRCRSFWDGGIHCLTTDIRRSGDCVDYWPGRI